MCIRDSFYAVGMGEGVINIYYNKDILDEAGIEPPKNIEDAWTWDEYYEICKQLTTDEIYGGNFIQEKSGEWIICAFQPFLIANGVETVSYTHLDVYKRQGFPSAGTPCSCTEDP